MLTPKPSEEVKFDTSIVMTTIDTTLGASTPAHSFSFPDEVGWFRTGSAFNLLGNAFLHVDL